MERFAKRARAVERQELHVSVPLSHGVAQLSGLYQLLTFFGVLNLMWYSEEASVIFPPYDTCRRLFIKPVFKALTIDMYQLDDLELRQKMLMIVQGVTLAAFFLLINRMSGRFITGDEDPSRPGVKGDFLSAVTLNTTYAYVLSILEVLEYFMVVKDFATEELVSSIVPNLHNSLFENLCIPVVKWSVTIGAWFVSNILTSTLLASVIHIAYVCRTRRVCLGDAGFRVFLKQFMLSRILVVLVWWYYEVSTLTVVTSWQTFMFLCFRSLAFSGCINLESHTRRKQREGLGIADASANDVNAANASTDCSGYETRPDGIPYTQVFKELMGHAQFLTLRPLFMLLGSLSVVLLPHTIALLVVIFGMYLFMIWLPASMIVLSTDFFSNVAVACTLVYVSQYRARDWASASTLRDAGWIYVYVMELFLVLSYIERSVGTAGAMFALMCFMLVYPEVSDNLRVVGFAIIGCIAYIARSSDKFPTPIALVRRLLHSAVSSCLLFGVLAASYGIPATWTPRGLPKFPLMMLIVLPLTGVMKETERSIFTFVDKFFFDLHVDSDNEEDDDSSA